MKVEKRLHELEANPWVCCSFDQQSLLMLFLVGGPQQFEGLRRRGERHTS